MAFNRGQLVKRLHPVPLLHILLRERLPLREVSLFPLIFQEELSEKSSPGVGTCSWLMSVSASDKLKCSLLYLSPFFFKNFKNLQLKEIKKNIFQRENSDFLSWKVSISPSSS